jgi:hypothetical protein
MKATAAKLVLVVGILMFPLLISEPMLAQVAHATLSGAITDPSGAAARTEQASQDGNEMDEKNGQIAHRGMPAGRGILRNLGRNNNSPATPGLLPPHAQVSCPEVGTP